MGRKKKSDLYNGSPIRETSFDPEEGEERLKAYYSEHPQKGSPNTNAKREELMAHNKRFLEFMGECKKRRGMSISLFDDPEELVKLIDDYLACVMRIGLFPTEQGLALFANLSSGTFAAYKQMNDSRGQILKKFKEFVSEYFNQSGLASDRNSVFSIYYGKSVLGQTDQPNTSLNVNIQQNMYPGSTEVAATIDDTPDSW